MFSSAAKRGSISSRSSTTPLQMFKQFYFDALTHHPQAIRHLIDMAGSERVVLGTDSPFDMGEEQPIERLEAVPRLTDKEREDVCHRSALALFGGAL